MNSPLISVIVPVYNKEKYVAKLIDCIQKQEFRDFECIMVDDGSTDKSGKICDEMTSCDSAFSVIHIQNNGVSHARNVALDIAKGEYITFLDSDDEIPIDYLKKIAVDIRLYNPDMVIGGIKKVFESGSEEIIYPFDERLYTMQELLPQFAEAQRECGVFGWCVNKTFRRELAASCRFNINLSLYEDFDFYLGLYSRIQTVYFEKGNYYLYLSKRSLFSSFKDSQIDYLAQAKIQLRCKLFLEKSGYWDGSNEEIVSQRIQDYLFFALFHSTKEVFDERFEGARSCLLGSGIIINENDIFRKAVLYCLEKNKRVVAKSIISIRRKL